MSEQTNATPQVPTTPCDTKLDDATLAQANGGVTAIHPLRKLRCDRCGRAPENGRFEGATCTWCGGTIESYIDTYGTPFV